ncbi:MAG: class I SAM-dependent methyltransferase [Acidobacteria bacterium]|nr:class I SAM-dependent methyltransferase [Acidobacteriota bacterium]
MFPPSACDGGGPLQLPSLNQEITCRYYKTTAIRGHRPTREYYEQAAPQLGRRLKGWLPQNPDARCLDLACGCGDLLYLLERRGIVSTTGVDLCGDELNQARLFVQGKLVLQDAVEFLKEQPDGSYDFISALNFLEHLSKDKLLAVIEQSRRVLAPGGTLIAMVPNALSIFGSTTRYWDLTHEWAFTPNNFRQLAALCHFDPGIEFRECGPLAHGLLSTLRVMAWTLMRVAISAWLLVEVADRKGGIYTMDMLVRLRRPALANVE